MFAPVLTPELRRLTSPPEQEFIIEMGADLEDFRYYGHPAYRTDLPGHNYDHVYREALPESLRLLAKDGETNTPYNRRLVGAVMMLHDIASTVPLDPDEGFETVEERSATLALPFLSTYFGRTGAQQGHGLILATADTATIETPLERVVRRADIHNVGSKAITLFVARTLDFFHEDVILYHEGLAEKRPVRKPLWLPFLDGKVDLLSRLVEPDLSIGMEQTRIQPDGRRRGRFNLQADSNIDYLRTDRIVRDPDTLYRRRGGYLRPLVADFETVMGYVRDQAAA